MKVIHKHKKRPKIYAIAGVNHGNGVTHISLALANYCHSKLMEDVTFIEVTNQSCIFDLVNEREKIINNSVLYLYKGVKYLTACTVEEAKEYILSARGICVMDIGELDDVSRELLVLAERKIIVGSIRPWKQREFIEFLIEKIVNKIDTRGILFLCDGINRKEKKKIDKIIDIRLYEKPIINNPFYIKKEEFEKMDFLLL